MFIAKTGLPFAEFSDHLVLWVSYQGWEFFFNFICQHKARKCWNAYQFNCMCCPIRQWYIWLTCLCQVGLHWWRGRRQCRVLYWWRGRGGWGRGKVKRGFLIQDSWPDFTLWYSSAIIKTFTGHFNLYYKTGNLPLEG